MKNNGKFHGVPCKAVTDRCKRAQGVFDAWQVLWVFVDVMCGKAGRFCGFGAPNTPKSPKKSIRGKRTKASKQGNAVFAQADIDALSVNPCKRCQSPLCVKVSCK